MWTCLNPFLNNEIAYHFINNYCVGGETGLFACQTISFKAPAAVTFLQATAVSKHPPSLVFTLTLDVAE